VDTSTAEYYWLRGLGRQQFENAVPCPLSQPLTIVMGNEDFAPGMLTVWLGNKTATGSIWERAGLVYGRAYGVKIEGYLVEGSTNPAPLSNFSLIELIGISGQARSTVKVLRLSWFFFVLVFPRSAFIP
jgi:hypothetical protein